MLALLKDIKTRVENNKATPVNQTLKEGKANLQAVSIAVDDEEYHSISIIVDLKEKDKKAAIDFKQYKEREALLAHYLDYAFGNSTITIMIYDVKGKPKEKAEALKRYLYGNVKNEEPKKEEIAKKDSSYYGDVIDNPTIAPSNDYGNLKGGTYGCTRNDPDHNCENIKGLKIHTGIDLKCNKGTDVKAALDGEIIYIRDDFKSDQYAPNSYGNQIRIRSRLKDGTYIIYEFSHLDKILIKNGKVTKGQVIALSGATGNPGLKPNGKWGISLENRHVHLEVFVGTEKYDKMFRRDPSVFIKTKFDSNGQKID